MKKIFTIFYSLLICNFAIAQIPANNECSGAIDLNAFLGEGLGNTVSTSEYDNTDATTESSDPSDGYECYGEPDGGGDNPTLENTLWFSFTGDGNTYYIETTNCGGTASPYVSDGDTQISIYSGICGELTAEGCNEDGPNATSTLYPAGITFETTSGVEYLMMIDGFAFNGVKSVGEFCIEITQEAGCSISGFTAGAMDLSSTASEVCSNNLFDIIIAFDGSQTMGLDSEDGASGYALTIRGGDGGNYYVPFEGTPLTLGDLDAALGGVNGIDTGMQVIELWAWAELDIDESTFPRDASCFATSSNQLMINIIDSDDSACDLVMDPNVCVGAMNVQFLLGQGIGTITTSSTQDNTSATTEDSDPDFGYECFGEPDGGGDNPSLESTLWYRFTGDGNTYFIETTNCDGNATNYINDGDTQIAIYSGSCGNLSAEGCNEDGPNATDVIYPAGITFQTEMDKSYFMMIDGFSFNGAESRGEFCIEFTQTEGCSIAGFSAGAMDLSVAPSEICSNMLDDVVIAFDGTQTMGLDSEDGASGYALTVRAGDGGNYYVPFTGDPLTLGQLNEGLAGNGGVDLGAQSISLWAWSELDIAESTFPRDATCFSESSNQLMFTIIDSTDAGCTVSALNDIEILNVSNIYPVPATDFVNIDFFSVNSGRASVKLYDVTGKTIIKEVINVTSGDNTYKIGTDNLESGIYFASLELEENRTTFRVVVR